MKENDSKKLPFEITPLGFPGILDDAAKRPGAQNYSYGSSTIRIDITGPCSIYLRGEDGFRLSIVEGEARSDDELVSEFTHEGMTASYHFADDSGKEWRLGYMHQDAALAIWRAHPELEARFLEAGRNFLWSFSSFVETAHRKMKERGLE